MAQPRLTDEREHRRGLVLGLTLAEILLLLLFLLLLALASLLATRDRQLRELAPFIEQIRKDPEFASSGAEQLAARLKRIKEIEVELQKALGEVTDLRSELSTAKNTIAAAETARRELEPIMAGASKIDPNDPPAVLKRGLAVLDIVGATAKLEDLKAATELAAENQRLKTDLSNLDQERERVRRERDNLMRISGKGTTFPSCWINAAGQTEYVFDISVRDAGLIVHGLMPSNPLNEPALKLVDVQRDTQIPAEQFVRGTSRMFSWSVEQKCRFFVKVRDETGRTSKVVWKRQLRLIEGNFYKLLVSEGRPATDTKDAGAGEVTPGLPAVAPVQLGPPDDRFRN